MQEMLMVYVGIHSKQSFEDCLGNRQEILWKGNT